MEAEHQEINQKLDTLIERQSHIQNVVEQDHKAIYGNGSPGLKDRILVIETKFWLVAGAVLFIASRVIWTWMRVK